MFPSPLLIHLTSSFLISNLRLTIEPESKSSHIQIPLILTSPNRNISLSLQENHLLAGNLPISEIFTSPSANGFTLTIGCQHGLAFRINMVEQNAERVIMSPSFCTNHGMNGLLIGPDDRIGEIFYGCIRNVTHGSIQLLESWCRFHSANKRNSNSTVVIRSALDPLLISDLNNFESIQQLIFLGDKIQVLENGLTSILWKNLYLFPESQRYGINNEDVKFEIVNEPEHGRLFLVDSFTEITLNPRFKNSKMVEKYFTYNDIITQRLEYHHDGSETIEDSFDVQVSIDSAPRLNEKFRMSNIYSIPIIVEPVDDPPKLSVGSKGPVINLAPGARVKLTEEHLKIWDDDTPTNEVWLEVQRANAVRITDRRGLVLKRFNLAQFLNGKLYLSSDGGDGEIEILAHDSSQPIQPPITLRVTSVPIEIRMGINSGLQLPHRSNRPITAQNLSFSSNFHEIPIKYSVVDQPEFGIIECLRESTSTISEENFQLCSNFEQTDIDSFRIRYRHISNNRPQTDSFSFQVQCASTSSIVYVFHIQFIAISLRVFIQESLILNNTEQAEIGTKNLFATAFPHNFPKDQLIYHIVEPPKYGMLSRRIFNEHSESRSEKLRRVGVSSNFTQEHVDINSILYKLHFIHYSVVNDFFSFRLITPAIVSELLRFDITYIPGGNSIHLLNRTIIVKEGASQFITNNSLWLETPDDTNFVFTVLIPPFNGQLVVRNEYDAKFILDNKGTFNSFDILNKRLIYEHLGDETPRSDRAYLMAESVYGKHARIPLWLTFSIIGENNHAPQLRDSKIVNGLPTHQIHLIETSERVLYPALFPWIDADNSFNKEIGTSALSFHFPELFRDFIISSKESPEISVHNFTNANLQANRLIIRHLTLKKEAKMRYTISDGKHTSQSVLHLFVSKPFIRLENNRILIPQTALKKSINDEYLLLNSHQIRALSNLDADPNSYRFRVHPGTPPVFRLLKEGVLIAVSEFTQADVEEFRLFLSLNLMSESQSKLTIPMKISATATGELEEYSREISKDSQNIFADAILEVEKSEESLKNEDSFIIVKLKDEIFDVASSLTIDSGIVNVMDSTRENFDNVKFVIVELPKLGTLVLKSSEEEGPILSSNNFIWGFRQRDLNFARLQYINTKLDEPSNFDTISINISTAFSNFRNNNNNQSTNLFSQILIGPLKIRFKIIDRNQFLLIPPKNLFIEGNLTLTPRILRLLTPADSFIDYSKLEYRLVEKPNFVQILNRHTNQTILSAFNHAQLQNGDIILVPLPDYEDSGQVLPAEHDVFIVLRACTNSLKQAKCSMPSKIKIIFKMNNKMAPEMIRNEVLSINKDSKSAKITSQHLKALDADTPPTKLKYLIWQPIGGHLVWNKTLNEKEIFHPLQSFTQSDLDDELVLFVPDKNFSSGGGFSFLVSDFLHQTRPEWFSIELMKIRKTVIIEVNRKLNVPPGLPTLISMDYLYAKIVNVSDNFVQYRVTQLPMNGRLLLENVHKPINEFTQGDINSKRLFYQSQTADLGTWSQRDSFSFVVGLRDELKHGEDLENLNNAVRRRKIKKEDEFRFKTSISYSNIAPESLHEFIPRAIVNVGKGGSVAFNVSHLNLTLLSNYCDDELFVEVYRWPKSGVLLRVRDELASLKLASVFTSSSGISGTSFSAQDPSKSPEISPDDDDEEDEDYLKEGRTFKVPFTADELQSGRHLIYVDSGSAEKDEIIFTIYPLREKHKRSSRLKVPVDVTILVGPKNGETPEKIEKFRKVINIVSGGLTTLSPADFQASHPSKTPSQIFYRILQPSTNGIRFILNGREIRKRMSEADSKGPSNILEFSQAQLNKGLVGIEHTPLSNDDKFDVITMRVGSLQTRALIICIEPLALQLFNHSVIAYEQGKTFVVLNRTHLGASSNGERSRIFYNITRPPQNGTFYWVAGEKEANWFTQKNVDNGDLLYAQLNMNAFQDSFDFVLGNDEMELLEKTSNISVVALIKPQRFVTEARTITQIGLIHLNATILEGSSPRFLVITPPENGRLFLHPNHNETIIFFTHSDIQNGRLFFHAFDPPQFSASPGAKIERIRLEMRADSVQPARIDWIVEIRPLMEPGLKPGTRRTFFRGDSTDSETLFEGGDSAPELDFRFPIIILVVVLISIMFMLFCRNNKSKDEKKDNNGQKEVDNEDSPTLDGISSPLMQKRHLPDLEDIVRIQNNGQYGSGLETSSRRTTPTRGFTPTKKSTTSELLDSTVYATLGRPHLQTQLSTRNNNLSHKSLEPIVNPCATGSVPLLMPPPKRPSVIVPTFGTFEDASDDFQAPKTPTTITLPTPQNSSIRQKQQAQLAVAAMAAANSRNSRSKDAELRTNEEEPPKDSNGDENIPQTKLKENQYWV